MSSMTGEKPDLFRNPPPRPDEWTVDDLAYLPEGDRSRYELLNGELLVSPSPIPLHQDAVLGICVLLRAACPPDLKAYVAPVDYEIGSDTMLVPDVVVMRRADVDPHTPLRQPAVLVVEVISPSSRKPDLEKKPLAYAMSGVEHYWTFDPDEPHFVAWRREGAEFVMVAEASDRDRIRLDEPFAVEICPAEIING